MISAPKELCTEHPVYTHHLSKFSELAELNLPSPHSIILLAANFQTVSTKVLTETANTLIKRGNAYLCAWGESCTKAESAWDSAITETNPEKSHGFHVVSTSHEDETLEEAVWYALNCAFVDKHIAATCSVILITIDQPEWQNEIDEISENPAAFNERALEDAGAEEPGSDEIRPPIQ